MLPHDVFLAFVLYSVFGWALDTLYRSWSAGRPTMVTFLPFPFCPIYGIGAVLALWMGDWTAAWPLWLQGIVFAGALGLFELVSGEFLLAAFGRRLWKYRGTLGNLRGFTDLPHAAAWGLLALGLVHAHPWIEAAVVDGVVGRYF